MKSRFTTAGQAFASVAALSLLAACTTSGTSDVEESHNPDATAIAAAAPEGTAYPLTINNCGDDLALETEPASVLTIGTTAVALLDAAGAADRIVARSGEFGADLPESLVNPPVDAPIVDDWDPTIENIVGSGAEVIVGYGLWGAEEEDVANAGIPNIIVEGECSHDGGAPASTFQMIFDDILRLGEVFNTSAEAEANVAALQAELDAIDTNISETGDAAVVYFFSSTSGMSAQGGLAISNEMLQRVGLGNAFGDQESTYLETSIESLLGADPSVIIIAYGFYGETFEDAKARLLEEPGAADLHAFEHDHVIGIHTSQLATAPDAVQGLRALVEALDH